MAKRFGLRVAAKDDSQDLCFIADGNYRNFMRRNRPDSLVAGPILDIHGNRLGTHTGLPDYTIGQRKGLGIAAHEPLYVTTLDASRNALVVGGADELGKGGLTAGNVNWIPPRLGEELRQAGGSIQARVKIRYRSVEHPATITSLPSLPPLTPDPSPSFDCAQDGRGEQVKGEQVKGEYDECVRVEFETPLRDITPGQAAVFYDGEICLGGGIIQAMTYIADDIHRG